MKTPLGFVNWFNGNPDAGLSDLVRIAVLEAVEEAKAAYRAKSFLGPAGWMVSCDVADEAIDAELKKAGY